MSKGKTKTKKKSAWDIMSSFTKKKQAINRHNPAPGLPSNKLNIFTRTRSGKTRMKR